MGLLRWVFGPKKTLIAEDNDFCVYYSTSHGIEAWSACCIPFQNGPPAAIRLRDVLRQELDSDKMRSPKSDSFGHAIYASERECKGDDVENLATYNLGRWISLGAKMRGLRIERQTKILTLPPKPIQNKVQHYWRYYDLQTRQILDNRFTIASLISCATDTPRVIGEADVFAIQEKVKDHILASVTEQAAAEAAPAIIKSIQQTLATVLKASLNQPQLERSRIRQALKRLGQPMMSVSLKQLKAAYQAYQKDKNVEKLLAGVEKLAQTSQETRDKVNTNLHPLTLDDLHLVFWEYVWS